MDIKYIGNIGPAAGEGSGGGGSSFDPTAITGYDATKKQQLLNDSGTLKWKNKTISYTNFSSDNRMVSVASTPSSFTDAKIFIHVKSSAIPSSPSTGQVFFSTEGNTANVGFTAGNYIDLYNGSSNVAGSLILNAYKNDYWLRIDVSGEGNASLYYILDSNYSFENLPTDLSSWTYSIAHTNYNITNKKINIGDSTSSYCPRTTIMMDFKMIFDDVLTHDLQDEADFLKYGNLIPVVDYV